jgi:hypothetical protein
MEMMGGCDGWDREEVVKPTATVGTSRDAVTRVADREEIMKYTQR